MAAHGTSSLQPNGGGSGDNFDRTNIDGDHPLVKHGADHEISLDEDHLAGGITLTYPPNLRDSRPDGVAMDVNCPNSFALRSADWCHIFLPLPSASVQEHGSHFFVFGDTSNSEPGRCTEDPQSNSSRTPHWR